MKKSILTLILAALVFGAGAETVTPEMARLAADAWAARNAAFGAGESATDVRAERDPDDAGRVLWYQVSMTGGGCLMIAPDTTIEPVICALDNDPGVLPAAHPLRGILTGDMKDRLAFLAAAATSGSAFGTRGGAGTGGLALSSASADEESPAAVARAWGAAQKAKWAKLGVGGPGLKLAEAETVGVTDEQMPLVIGIVDGFEKGGRFTHWNQASAGGRLCYNLHTPGNAVCGCVATATSAIMQFFGVRQFTLAEGAKEPGGGCTYNGKKFAAEILDPEYEYDWSILPKNWGGEAEESDKLTAEQADLLGHLAYNAGVCHDMMWTDGESGAFTTDTAKVLRDYFGFLEARNVTKITQDQYRKLIYMQNWAGAPVGMGIKGHAVVAVGYGKDSEGVERVRVFMGWGGAGDGWYALPYIDTTATLGGSSYLSTVVNSVTTMISLDDDNVVPVCVQLIPSINAPVTIDGEEKNANNRGFCGVRLSASSTAKGRDLPVECQDKTWTVAVPGADPKKGTMANKYAESAADLCAWIPDPLILPLVNVESATTFEDAQRQALAHTPAKPILAFSGSWGEETTDAAWKVIQEMDDANENDFTNKFVLLCLPYAPGDKISDGNPSVALFNPAALDTDSRWAFYNGRVAYWSAYNKMYTANEDPALGLTYDDLHDENTAANRWISEEDIRAGVRGVVDASPAYDLQVAAIRVTAVTDTPGTEQTNFCFEAVNQFFAGELTFTAPEVVTNAAQTIEYTCAGWTVSNLTTRTEVATSLEDDGADPLTAVFAAEEKTSYQVTWHWTPVKFKITVRPTLISNGGQNFPEEYAELVTLREQWCEPGETLTVLARPDCVFGTVKCRFSEWDCEGQKLEVWRANEAKVCGAQAWADGPGLVFQTGAYPASIRARYVSGATSVSGEGKCFLAIASTGADVETPGTLWGGRLLEETNDLGAGTMTVRLNGAPCRATDGEGNEWICTNWVFTTKGGKTVEGSDARGAATITLKAGTVDEPVVNTLTWVWTPYEAPAVVVEDVYEISWDEELANLSGAFTTNLISSADLATAGLTAADLNVTAPRGWAVTVTDDGENVTAALAPDAAEMAKSMSTVRMDILPAADGTLRVSADVPDGIPGFIYEILGSDDLAAGAAGWDVVATGEYVEGAAAAKAPLPSEAGASGGHFEVWIKVRTDTPRQFYKARVVAPSGVR